MRRRAVFLDRDGVLNRTVMVNGVSCPPADAGCLEIVPGAARAAELLRAAGYLTICVTNQPDVARGTRSEANVKAMNEAVRRAVPLDDLYACLHDDGDNCSCRKPKPGMLLEAAAVWNIDLAGSWMVGDRPSDVAAGRAAGCRTILIAPAAAGTPDTAPDLVCPDVLAAAKAVIIAS